MPARLGFRQETKHTLYWFPINPNVSSTSNTGMLLPLLRRSPIQLGHGAHLGPSAQTSVCPGESGFGPSSVVRELAPACASRASRGWVPCLRGKREQSSACMNNKHNTLLWRNLSSVRIPSLPLADSISDPFFSPVANNRLARCYSRNAVVISHIESHSFFRRKVHHFQSETNKSHDFFN